MSEATGIVVSGAFVTRPMPLAEVMAKAPRAAIIRSMADGRHWVFPTAADAIGHPTGQVVAARS